MENRFKQQFKKEHLQNSLYYLINLVYGKNKEKQID